MPDAQETKLIREATDIFLRLRDNPENLALQQERNNFLARGEAERSAYQKMLQAWRVTKPTKKPGNSTLPSLIIAALTIASGYYAFEPVSVALFSDLSTGLQTTRAKLASGDQVVLDATSALIDDTESADRKVTLLRGAAYFDVVDNGQPFVVTAGTLRVEVTGTSFEVSRLDQGGIVTVTDGSVDVTIGDQTVALAVGNQLSWSADTGSQIKDVELASAVAWREDMLVSDGMTFGQIAAILERRLPGGILISNSTLASMPIVGTFDLADPTASLDLLTKLTGSKATTLPYVVTIIQP